MRGLSRDQCFPPRADELWKMRRFGEAVLRGAGAFEDEVSEVVLAFDEACTNAVQHAGGRGPLVLGGRMLPHDVVRLSVRDFGHWHVNLPSDTRMPARGRGLPLMRQLVDRIVIRRHPDGTEIVLYRRLRKEGERAAPELSA